MTDVAPSNIAAVRAGAGSIVVGVDGSDESKGALRWALRQAELTGAELHVVFTWRFPTGYLAAPIPDTIDFAADARTVLDATVKEVVGPSPAVKVFATVIEGPAAPTLIHVAADADLLVVGSRGHGAFTGMLLGSVSEHCVSHATGPVVVVRGPKHAA